MVQLIVAPERVMLLANVIDVAAYSGNAEVQLKQPALLFAGTLSQGTANIDAGLWLLDEVMPIVWRQRPDAHLYLVGRSPAPQIQARRGQRVHVTGEVPSIVPYMHASAMAVVLSPATKSGVMAARINGETDESGPSTSTRDGPNAAYPTRHAIVV